MKSISYPERLVDMCSKGSLFVQAWLMVFFVYGVAAQGVPISQTSQYSLIEESTSSILQLHEDP